MNMFITCHKTNFAYQITFVHYLKSTRNTIPKTAILFHHSRTETIALAIWPIISNRYPATKFQDRTVYRYRFHK